MTTTTEPIDQRDFRDLRGLTAPAREAVRLTVSGRSMLLLGAPGIGRTMIARRLPCALPPLTEHEARWIAIEHDAAGLDGAAAARRRPFRAPHYTASTLAMIGTRSYVHHVSCMTPGAPWCVCGGEMVWAGPEGYTGRPTRHSNQDRTLGTHEIRRAGELHLARFGILMLDQLAEFPLATLDVIGHLIRKMAAGAPLIVATESPCPCGWAGSPHRACSCPPASIARWVDRIRRATDTLGITATIPLVVTGDPRTGEPCPSTAELVAQARAGMS